MAAKIFCYHASQSNNFDELSLPNKLNCKNLVDFNGKIFERSLFSSYNFFIFVQECWTYYLPKADRWWVLCLSWRHSFDDLSILNGLIEKSLDAFIQKSFFWCFFSLYNNWNSGTKWPRYDVYPDQLLNEFLDFNEVDTNISLFLSSWFSHKKLQIN